MRARRSCRAETTGNRRHSAAKKTLFHRAEIAAKPFAAIISAQSPWIGPARWHIACIRWVDRGGVYNKNVHGSYQVVSSMRIGNKVLLLACLVAAISCLAFGPAAMADSPGEQGASAPPAAQKLDSGDNAWLLTSSALVLMMTGPGLALFYSGLVRKKNVLSVMMQCVFLMCSMTVDMGAVRLHAGLRRQAAVDRRRHVPLHGQCAIGVARRQVRHAPVPRSDGPRLNPHALPVHVLHHYAGADLPTGSSIQSYIQYRGPFLNTLKTSY